MTAMAMDKLEPAGARQLSETVNRINVKISSQTEIIDRMTRCMEESEYCAEPSCLLVTGESGAGKTTAIENFMVNYPRYETSDGTVIPVLFSSIPSPASLKGIATQMLEDLGRELYSNKPIDQLTRLLAKLLKSSGVRLIILDEFSQVVEVGNYTNLMQVSDWIKCLINKTQIPVVLFGLPKARSVLDVNEQLRRRFSASIEIKPFTWGDTLASREEFRSFLYALDKMIPLPERARLADTEMAFRFYWLSRGYVSPVMKVIRRAAMLAFEEKLPRIDLHTLERAYGLEMKTRVLTPNPFAVDTEVLFREPYPTHVDDKDRNGGKRSRRSPDAQVREVLTLGRSD